MEIAGNSFKLREWQQGDEESLVKHADNKKIWDNVRNEFPHPYTWKDARKWIRANKDIFPVQHFAIDVQGEAAGGIGIVLKKDIYAKNAEIGYWLGESFWGKGLMSAALKAMVTYVFRYFDIVRIYAGVFGYNEASMKVLRKAGFREEAILKSAICKNGKILDEHIYSILKN